jgi:hypothetical protein
MSSHLISFFPEFVHLESLHLPLFKAFYHDHFPSDFTFTNVMMYDVEHQAQISRLHQAIVILTQNHTTLKNLASFVGHVEGKEAFFTLLDDLEKKGFGSKLSLVSEEELEAIHRQDFADRLLILEDRDNFDYVYSVKALLEMKGHHYDGKRNFITRFEESYLPYAKVKTYQGDEIRNVKERLLSIDSIWRTHKTSQEIRKIDQIAFERFFDLKLEDTFGCVVLEIQNQPQAFAIFEKLAPGYAIGHFKKANTDCVGIYAYLEKIRAQALSDFGINRINDCQDLGLEGLRKAKLSWQPTEWIKKYTISLKR